MSLFEESPLPRIDKDRPLAERMRPETLDEYVGQEHMLGPGKPLRARSSATSLTSMILWGPPGVGKTTLARLIARAHAARFRPVQRGAERHQGDQAVMADAERRRRRAAGGRSCSSTRFTASTRRSRTRSCPYVEARRHRPHRRDDREPVVRGDRGAAVAVARCMCCAALTRAGDRDAARARAAGSRTGWASDLHAPTKCWSRSRSTPTAMRGGVQHAGAGGASGARRADHARPALERMPCSARRCSTTRAARSTST